MQVLRACAETWLKIKVNSAAGDYEHLTVGGGLQVRKKEATKSIGWF